MSDMIEAIEVARSHTADVTLERFEADRDKRWLVERAVEIVSEASRHLSDELRARHPTIPWRQVADIGNVLRHNYARVAPEIIWAVVQDHLPELHRVYRQELAIAQANE